MARQFPYDQLPPEPEPEPESYVIRMSGQPLHQGDPRRPNPSDPYDPEFRIPGLAEANARMVEPERLPLPTTAEIKTSWKVASARPGSVELAEFLDDGWEPFSVTSEHGETIWLRRRVVG